MNDIVANDRLLSRVEVVVLFFLALFGNFPLFIVLYIFIAILLIFKTSLGTMQQKYKFILGLGYLALLTAEIIFAAVTIFSSTNGSFLHFILRLIGVVLMPLPLLLEKILIDRETQDFYLPSLSNIATISFGAFAANGAMIDHALNGISRLHQKASLAVMTELFQGIKKQSSTRYINHGSLTDAYFQAATATLADPHIYLAISNTGSPASEIISLFTRKQYNHASLSFDPELDTILSYNGGANVYPPGLNPEMVQDLHQKSDASVLIYALPATKAQKQEILAKLKKLIMTAAPITYSVSSPNTHCALTSCSVRNSSTQCWRRLI
ncbi:hypothetical protein [Lapidilactobacillus bayanensis]|uniref:hypothetical protein n=1 Tax=Lapidilactobacillus bayanensis TaxID=2485998 RepID=UPI001CDCB54B|nr:hypothetical protein [Lapidilactobacillus bayanensis]